MTSTGNQGLDALADAIAERVFQRLTAAQERNKSRLLDVPAAADYIGRSPSALRHLIAKGTVPCALHRVVAGSNAHGRCSITMLMAIRVPAMDFAGAIEP